MSNTRDLQRFLTLDEAASYLRIASNTLYGWVHRRQIPFRKHGSRLVFDFADLEKWSKGNEVKPQESSGAEWVSRSKRGKAQQGAGSLKTQQILVSTATSKAGG